MATATPPVSKNAVYPQAEIAKLLAPPEQEHPAAKLRRLLHEARDKGPTSTPPAPTTPTPPPS